MPKNPLYFLLILSICFSCHQSEQDKASVINGEWVLGKHVTKDRKTFTSYSQKLEFEKDTVFILLESSNVYTIGYFKVQNDSLMLDGHEYDIVKLTKDSLILENLFYKLFYNRRDLDFNPKLRLESIQLNTGLCFGPCPSFELTLDSTGIVTFIGKTHSKFQGDTTFQISKGKQLEIDSLFKLSQIERVNSADFEPLVDDWEMDITFYYNETSNQFKGTQSTIPFRLFPIASILVQDLRERRLI